MAMMSFTWSSPSGVRPMLILNNVKSLSLVVGPATRAVAQPLFFKSDKIEPGPSCPDKCDKKCAGFLVYRECCSGMGQHKSRVRKSWTGTILNRFLNSFWVKGFPLNLGKVTCLFLTALNMSRAHFSNWSNDSRPKRHSFIMLLE